MKTLTSAVINKTLRLSLHALEELHRGNKDFADYDIECSIEMTYDIDDCDETLRKLIELSWAFGHFFNHLSLFTVEDIMKIKPENFETKIKLTV